MMRGTLLVNRQLSHIAGLATAFATLLCGSGAVAWASEYCGRISDAETGNPIKGAVVVALVRARVPGLFEMRTRFHDAADGVTNPEGRVEIEGLSEWSLNPFAKIEAAVFRVFKPGYKPFGPARPRFQEGECFSVDLQRVASQEDRRAVVRSAYPVGVPETKVPSLIAAINEERARFGMQPIRRDREGKLEELERKAGELE